MKINTLFVTLFSAIALTLVVASNADADRRGRIISISCMNTEMNTEETKRASISFLGMKEGDIVSIEEVRKLAMTEDGKIKNGSGIAEKSSRITLLVQVEGYCQKDKLVRADDGSMTTVSVLGAVMLAIDKQ